MDQEYIECVRLAEEKNDLSFIVKMNGGKTKV